MLYCAYAKVGHSRRATDLKGWKPKGRSKAQRKRFHRWQHRALVKAVKLRAEELGMHVLEVYARGTSRYAYDGSGKVSRSKTNAQLATFTSGKQYNADINGAQNIAARGLAILFGIKNPRPAEDPEGGTRIPLVLADVWAWARKLKTPETAKGVKSRARKTKSLRSEGSDAPTTAGKA